LENYNDKINITKSPLPIWPGRYFVFAEVDEVRVFSEESYFMTAEEHTTKDVKNFFEVYHNVPLKLFQPEMKMSEVDYLLKYLEPLGFNTDNLNEDNLFVCDTFSKHEAFEINNFLNNRKFTKCWIQEAYLPLPFELGVGGLYRNMSQGKCGFIDFSLEENYRLCYKIYGYYDIDDFSSYMEPSSERLFYQKILELLSDKRFIYYKFTDLINVVENIVDIYQEEQNILIQKMREEDAALAKMEFEQSQNSASITNNDDDLNNDLDFYDRDLKDEMRENYDPILYNYYFDDDYDFEDFGEDY